MKPPRFFLPLVLATGLLALAGCESRTDDTTNQRTKAEVVTLDARAKKSLLTIKVGNVIRLLLPATAGDGYEWRLMLNDPRILRQTSEPKFVADESATGGSMVVTFDTLRPARVKIRFAYVKAGEKEGPAAKSYELAVQVKP